MYDTIRPMRQLTLIVAEMATSAGQITIHCRGPELNPTPGQFYLARAETTPMFLRQPIFPSLTREGGVEFCVEATHPLAALEPGAMVDVLGPCGRGFALGPHTAHVLVICQSPTRLLGLIHHALAQRLSVAVLLPATAPLPDVPLDVEIVRGEVTEELSTWADVVALDVPEPVVLARAIRALCPTRPADFVQALITPPMPCGVGACQACGAEVGKAHRQLACLSGPVFEL